MNIAIVGAMKEEVEFLINKLRKYKKKKIGQFMFYIGKLYKHKIILVESGIGKTMAGLLSGILFSRFKNISCLINVGCAGGVKPLQVSDIVVSQNVIYGDVDLTSGGFGYTYGQMAQCPKDFPSNERIINAMNGLDYHLGTICSCDSFTTSIEKTTLLQKTYFPNYKILCYDMESCSFAHAAYQYNIPFVAIRAISDVIGQDNQDNQYQNNYVSASTKSNEFLLEVLKRLNNI